MTSQTSSSMVSIQYRPSTVADLELEWSVLNHAQNALYRQHGFPREDMPFERFAPPRRHVLAHDPARSFVAEVDGRVVAFVGAIVRGDMWFLSTLFVDPEHQGKGIGQQLLQRAAAGWPPRRLTISDAIQPISIALYARAGLLPSTPILVMGGEPEIDAPIRLEEGEASAADLAALDQAGYGFDRAHDHDYWRSQSELSMWYRDAEPLAYAYVTEQGWLGPLVGRDEESAALALRAELSRRPRVTLEIPGSSSALVETAFAAGLRIVNPPGLLLHSRPIRLPNALVISGYWLL
jgi:GNAT superfamily N-acetyltransferase